MEAEAYTKAAMAAVLAAALCVAGAAALAQPPKPPAGKPGPATPQTPGFHNLVHDVHIGGKPGRIAWTLFLPAGYRPAARPVPLLLFLSGSGEKGFDHGRLYVHGPSASMQRDKKLAAWAPMAVLTPQCPAQMDWSHPAAAQLALGLVDHVLKHWRIDSDRLYVSGLSMGGRGTWRVLLEAPGRFAAAAPISAVLIGPALLPAAVRKTTVWVIYGSEDGQVTIDSRKAVQVLRSAGVDVIGTEVPGGDHGVWGHYYASRRFYEFLLAHRRGRRPKRRPGPKELLGIAWKPPKSVDVELKGPFAKFLPWWQLINCGPDMSPGLRAEHAGRRNVFVTHPLNPKTPCVLMSVLPIPVKGRSVLHIEVGHHPQGDWLLVVRIDGKVQRQQAVGAATARGGWLSVKMDMTPWAGRKAFVELLNQPTGWAFEVGYWSKVALETTGGKGN